MKYLNKIVEMLQSILVSAYPKFHTLTEEFLEFRSVKFAVQDFLRSRSDINRLLYPLDRESTLCYSRILQRLGLPFKLFPDVSKFEVKVSPLDWVFLMFGIIVRSKIKNKMIRSHTNRKYNRHLFFKYCTLLSFVRLKDWRSYWSSCEALLDDKLYLLVSLNHILPDWYRFHSIKKVDTIINEVSYLIKNRSTKIDFKRVYIEKSNGKKRPLGVPTVAWRIYLHMLNNFIVMARVESMGSQHGYFPSRGTSTVWKDIIGNIEKYRFIYEFDMKGFFDNVDLGLIQSRLQENYGINSTFNDLFLNLNRSLVKLSSEDAIPEPDRLILRDADKSLNQNTHLNVDTTFSFSSLYPLLSSSMGGLFQSDSSSTFKVKGVPQGAATSCSLSTLSLEHVTDSKELNDSNVKTIMYADDGLIFANSESQVFEVLSLLEISGSLVSPEKSKWFKFDNKYCGNLKFCGLRLDPFSFRLFGSTRKGSSLEFSNWGKLLIYLKGNSDFERVNSSDDFLKESKMNIKSLLQEDLLKYFNSVDSIIDLFDSSSCGLFISKLYNNSFNNFNYKINKNLNYFKGSWVDCILYEYIFKFSRDRLVLHKFLLNELEWNLYNLFDLSSSKLSLRDSSWGKYLIFSERIAELVKEIELKSHMGLCTLEIIDTIRKELSHSSSKFPSLRFKYWLSEIFKTLDLLGDVESESKNVNRYCCFFRSSISNCSSFACSSLCDTYLNGSKLYKRKLITYYAPHSYLILRNRSEIVKGSIKEGISKRIRREFASVYSNIKLTLSSIISS